MTKAEKFLPMVILVGIALIAIIGIIGVVVK